MSIFKLQTIFLYHLKALALAKCATTYLNAEDQNNNNVPIRS